MSDDENLSMYILERGDGYKEYRYGAPWVATMLWIEGGFSTEEEAMNDWYKTGRLLDSDRVQPELLI